MSAKNHFVCLACGFIVAGSQPPDKCPICGAPKRAFNPRHEISSAPSLKSVLHAKTTPAPQKGGNHRACLACGHIYQGNNPPDLCPRMQCTQKCFQATSILLKVALQLP